MLTIYGIKNCDTMKKAFKWLDDNHIEYQFHNYKTAGLSPELLQTFIDLLGWQTILNTRGTTWRKLDDSVRNSIDNEQAAKTIMLDNTSIIKRPILLKQDKALVGFSDLQYQQFFEN